MERGAVFVFLANAAGMYPPFFLCVNQIHREQETERLSQTAGGLWGRECSWNSPKNRV